MDPWFAGSVGFFPLQESPTEPREGHSYPIEIQLDAPERVGVGEPFRLTLTVKNLTAVSRTILRALDGSVEHLREPYYDLYLKDEGGTTYVWSFEGERCGNINRIRESDYLLLRPYESAADSAGPWADHLRAMRIQRSGHFVLWLVYQDCGDRRGGVRVGADEYRPTELGIFASNPVQIEVH